MLKVTCQLNDFELEFRGESEEGHEYVFQALSKCVSDLSEQLRKRRYTVILSAYRGEQKIRAIKELRAWTGKPLKEAKALMDALEAGDRLHYLTLASHLTKVEAEELVERCIEIGFSAHYE